MNATPQDVTENWLRLGAHRREAALVFGAVLTISLLVVLWLLLTRKRRQRHARHHGRSHQSGMNPETTSNNPALAMPRRRKWRRRRRDHRPRNPTLAETGGLPPVRRDGPGQSVP